MPKDKLTSDTAPMTGESPIENLSEALSFRISRLAAINERNGSHHFRNHLGVNLSEWRVIGLVAEYEPMLTSALRDILVTDHGLLSRIVKELVSRGLLISQPCAADKRQTELSLTPEGRDLHNNCIPFTIERNAVMASVLSPEEQAELYRLLDVMIAHNAALLKAKQDLKS
ncbi:MarR family winged helix-turn-helix transcriptional regulator [Neptunicoccus sediminis]|uniref:MarR family winged helix-turn-helix transcriptional regulator n=1 Tax=Neptunicoccus sediminis TaxID=1892596 RepID=UPI0008461127|nr:MarR family winged helix-turn-helix transcriptional regulator [Neptunicoccus sediminis]